MRLTHFSLVATVFLAVASLASAQTPAPTPDASPAASPAKRVRKKKTPSPAPVSASSTPTPAATPSSGSMRPAPARETSAQRRAAGIAANTPNAAQAPGGGPGLVWVNPKSKVYHSQASRWYGRTKHGKYMSEAEAKAAGNHAAPGKE